MRALLPARTARSWCSTSCPRQTCSEVRHRFLDLNLPFADGTLFKLLKEERPDAIVHLAQLRSPSRQATYAHELNAIGALHVFAAAGEAKIPRILLGSTSLVYGARGDNPNFLSEEHPLRPDPEDRFVGDFVEAESHARTHVRRHPESRVQILRFVPLLSPDVRDYRARLFAAPFSWQLLGYDPLVQALHPDDAVDALVRALDRPEAQGVFNIAPEGVVPLSTVRLLFGSLGIPVPHPLGVRALRGRVARGRGPDAGRSRALSPLFLRRGRREGPAGAGLRGEAHDARGRSRDGARAVRVGTPRGLRRRRGRGPRRSLSPTSSASVPGPGPAAQRGSGLVSARRHPSLHPAPAPRRAPRRRGRSTPSLLPKNPDDPPARRFSAKPRAFSTRIRSSSRRARSWTPWNLFRNRSRTFLLDDFGYDEVAARAVGRALRLPLHRVVARDAERSREHPERGPRAPRRESFRRPAVGRRDGQARHRAASTPRTATARMLVLDMFTTLPFLQPWLRHMGEVRACPENGAAAAAARRARRAFSPRASRASASTSATGTASRGSVAAASSASPSQTGAPIIPVTVVGAEEIHPNLTRSTSSASRSACRTSRSRPTFPLLGPLGFLPLPTKWWIDIGKPIAFDHGPEIADRPMIVNELADKVRTTLQTMIDSRLARRGNVFTGE